VGSAEVFYPGPAHTRDNVVVWLAESRVLFGGCAVRAASDTSVGNVADADVKEWPASIRRVRDRYPTADVVVPGHGDPGGRELLEHTLALLAPKPVR
jgi:metallo-beta-lactamase class B